MDVRTERRTVVRLLIACLCLGLALASAAGAQNVVIKMATLVPQGSDWYTTLQEMGADSGRPLRAAGSRCGSTRAGWRGTTATWCARCAWARWKAGC